MKKKLIKNIILTGILTLLITNINYTSASAKWIKDAKNNWSWIENKDKAIGWKKIDNRWYYFSNDGIMNTGWLNYNGGWYNLADNGEMSIGWKKTNGKWYHFNLDGKMDIGWINDNGTWYFTNSNGEMETGTIGIDGKVYTFSDTGAMLTGKNEIQNVKDQTELQTANNSDKDKSLRTAYVLTNDSSLNIRSKATISSDIMGALSKGAKVKILDDETNGFYPIDINGQKGWVSSKWISFEEPENDASDTSSNSDSSKLPPPPINNGKNVKLEDDSLDKDIIRDTAPSLDNKHYYSDDNLFYKIKLSPPFSSGGKLIKGNCTWYAWGRAWELTGKKPDDAGFIGNAYEWWDANKKSGKYKYGSQAKVGSIAVWKSNLPNSGGSGHVAIVEKISDGKIYISESTWNGENFRYREIYETNYLYGYIYLDKPNF